MSGSTGKLGGRVAIVTGAASGIGEAIAKLYLAEGACCIVADLPGSKLVEIFGGTGAARCVALDTTDDDAPGRLVGAAVEAFGGLDILVNNAGIAIAGQFEELTDEQFDRIMAVNVRSYFRIARAAVPEIRKRGGGRIINLGSIMSEMGGPTLSLYGASKHAVAGLSKGMAVDLGKYGITVNYLQPGSIWTGMSRPFMADENFRKYWENKAPMGRIGDPEDVAAAALFLASDEAKFVSGHGLHVDGGAIINF
jgi:NAD(P)-dependent dehydrogenase (short-subunit alcohol dehydrogenase family)